MPKKKHAVFFIILALIFLSCASLWLIAGYPVTHISSQDGTRDLREVDFDSGSLDLLGPVEYIPSALLAPGEFEARRSEIHVGSPEQVASFSTSRLRVYVPAGIYGLMLYSGEYACNLYINGHLAEKIGVPASDAVSSRPGTKRLYYTVQAQDGTIEIVQQASTYAVPDGDSHSNVIIGKPETVREAYDRTNMISSVVMGCFLALFLAHLVLYSLLRHYKANLWFALFCLMWFVRTGFTDPWILSSFLSVSWTAAFRVSCLAYPVGTLLFYLTLSALFPFILQKWFRSALCAVCGICACICLFTDTVFVMQALSYFNIIILLVASYIIIRLCIKLRKPNLEQITILIGMGIFLFGVVWDILYFDVLPTSPDASELTRHTLTEFTLLIFVFFQMAAMFHGTMREIAAAREAEQRQAMEAETQRRLNTMKSEFMGELSHELRMPISAISGFAQYFQELLGDETPDIDDLRYGARRVESEAERMDRLVSQLMDMAAIEAGVLTIRKGRVSVEELFDRIRQTYFPMWGRANNRLIIKLDDGITVFADHERVLQVLLNLVSNACKYTEDGEITLAASEENGTVRFSVADTGEGMAPDVSTALFTRYPQMRGGVKGVTGNGLGLFISKKLVEAHGGVIGVNSEPGKGTEVWFTIPINGELRMES